MESILQKYSQPHAKGLGLFLIWRDTLWCTVNLAVSCECTCARACGHLVDAPFLKVNYNYKMLFMEDIKVHYNCYAFQV